MIGNGESRILTFNQYLTNVGQVSKTHNERRFLQRFLDFSADTKGVKLTDRFSLCLKQDSTIILHDISYQQSTNIRIRHVSM